MNEPTTPNFDDGQQRSPGVPTDQSNQPLAGENAKPPGVTIGSPSSSFPALGDCGLDFQEAQRRLMLLRAFRSLLADGLSPKAAAKQAGAGRVSLWRWEQSIAGLDVNNPHHERTVLEKLAAPCAKAEVDQRGRKSPWSALVLVAAVQNKLREIHAATLRASSDTMTRDRRTANVAATLRLFTIEPECPPALRPLLLAGKFPDPLVRFLAQVTPEVEALIRGPKHFQLNGFSGSRDKTIGLPDGRRAYLPAGYLWELDDMSVNQPFWVDWQNGASRTCLLSRQGLYARCVRGRWIGVELVSRPREAYQSVDILRFIRRLCQLYGKPRKIRIERSVWAARNIAGFKLEGDEWREETYARPAMDDDARQNLADGLNAIGIEIEYCHSARGKSDLEGAFDPFQTYLAGHTRDFQNIGRHAGEFERAAKQLRRVRAGSHHPRDLGFAHQNELLERILQTFDFINGLPRPNGTHDEVWLRDTAKHPLTPLAQHDLAAFLPTVRHCTITGGAVYPQVGGRTFPFRAIEFATLGDGFRVYVRFDEAEPALGAAIYNREGDNLRNHQNFKDGDQVCLARFDVPAPTTFAVEAPVGAEVRSVEEIYGAGAEADGGTLLKQQRKATSVYVRSAFGGRLPGQPKIRQVEVRDGHNVAKVQVGSADVPMSGSGVAAVLPEPRLPARPISPRATRSVGASDDYFERQSARLALEEERANRRSQQLVQIED